MVCCLRSFLYSYNTAVQLRLAMETEKVSYIYIYKTTARGLVLDLSRTSAQVALAGQHHITSHTPYTLPYLSTLMPEMDVANLLNNNIFCFIKSKISSFTSHVYNYVCDVMHTHIMNIVYILGTVDILYVNYSIILLFGAL